MLQETDLGEFEHTFACISSLVPKKGSPSIDCASWLFPMLQALGEDIRTFHTQLLSDKTLQLIDGIIETHEQNLISDYLYLAFLLDPFTTLHKSALAEKWLTRCTAVLQRVYGSGDWHSAQLELLKLVNRDGNWGSHVDQCQSTGSHQGVSSAVSNVIAPRASQTERHDLLWATVFMNQFPLLSAIAARLLTVSTRSYHVSDTAEKCATLRR